MERFAKDCVNVFCELSGYAKDKVGTAPTPFLDEANDPLLVLEEPVSSPPQGGTAGKGKNTPPPQGGAVNAVGTGSGKLSNIADRVLMEIMYIARLARQDLLRVVGALTTMITRWGEMCDRKLFRIIKYMNGSAQWRHIGFIGGLPRRARTRSILRCRFCWGQGRHGERFGCCPRPVRHPQLLPAKRTK